MTDSNVSFDCEDVQSEFLCFPLVLVVANDSGVMDKLSFTASLANCLVSITRVNKNVLPWTPASVCRSAELLHSVATVVSSADRMLYYC